MVFEIGIDIPYLNDNGLWHDKSGGQDETYTFWTPHILN